MKGSVIMSNAKDRRTHQHFVDGRRVPIKGIYPEKFLTKYRYNAVKQSRSLVCRMPHRSNDCLHPSWNLLRRSPHLVPNRFEQSSSERVSIATQYIPNMSACIVAEAVVRLVAASMIRV